MTTRSQRHLWQDCLSRTCMISHADMWPSLQQAKRILAGIFSRIAEGFAEPLTAALSHAAQAEPAAPGAFQGQQWPGADADEPSLLEGPAARKRQKLGYSGRRRSVAQVSQTGPEVPWQGGLIQKKRIALCAVQEQVMFCAKKRSSVEKDEENATVMPGKPAQSGFRFHNAARPQGMMSRPAGGTNLSCTYSAACHISVCTKHAWLPLCRLLSPQVPRPGRSRQRRLTGAARSTSCTARWTLNCRGPCRLPPCWQASRSA